MTAVELLTTLQALNVRLSPTQDAGLRIRAPKGVLTEDLRAALHEHKTELVGMLRERAGAAEVVSSRSTIETCRRRAEQSEDPHETWAATVEEIALRWEAAGRPELRAVPARFDLRLQDEIGSALKAGDSSRALVLIDSWRGEWIRALREPDFESTGALSVINALRRGGKGLQVALKGPAAWSPEFRELIGWFATARPPEQPFALDQARRVSDPARYFEYLRRDVDQGPSGPRARSGALESDLKLLRDHLGCRVDEESIRSGEGNRRPLDGVDRARRDRARVLGARQHERSSSVTDVAGQNAAPAGDVEAIQGQQVYLEANMKMTQFASGYLRADDVREPRVVTIHGVQEEVVGRNGEGDAKVVCRFEELRRALVLNQTTIRQLIEILGTDESEDWIGRKVTLYCDPEVYYKGERTGGLRFRAAPPQQE